MTYAIQMHLFGQDDRLYDSFWVRQKSKALTFGGDRKREFKSLEAAKDYVTWNIGFIKTSDVKMTRIIYFDKNEDGLWREIETEDR